MTVTPRTRFVTSADGTAIAYDVTGTGPAVVVVEGALCQRTMGTARAVARLLSEHYAVVAYDRRGRGESGPGSLPYAVQREVEDLVARGAAGGHPRAEGRAVRGKSPVYMENAQAALATALPGGALRELPGQTHIVRGKATVPVL